MIGRDDILIRKLPKENLRGRSQNEKREKKQPRKSIRVKAEPYLLQEGSISVQSSETIFLFVFPNYWNISRKNKKRVGDEVSSLADHYSGGRNWGKKKVVSVSLKKKGCWNGSQDAGI